MSYLWPVLLALGLWWLSTIVLLWRLRLPKATFPLTLTVVSVLAAGGIVAVALTLDATTWWSAVLAFAGGLAIWCWHEAVYFLGYLSGPRPKASPPGVSQWRRFCNGVNASLYHELAVMLTALLLLAISWRSANPVAAHTLTILWLMRWSSKLNIFFGVSNLHEEYWPPHLSYLSSYVAQSGRNYFYPVSIALALALMVWMLTGYADSTAADYRITATALTLTLLALACIEHLFLLVKVPDHLIWQLGLAAPLPAPDRASVRAALANGDAGPAAGRSAQHRD